MPEYIDLAASELTANVVMVVTDDSEERHEVTEGRLPYFGRLIEDTLNGTDLAMPQAHTLMAAEVSLRAQAMSDARARKNTWGRSRLSGFVYQRVMQKLTP